MPICMQDASYCMSCTKVVGVLLLSVVIQLYGSWIFSLYMCISASFTLCLLTIVTEVFDDSFVELTLNVHV